MKYSQLSDYNLFLEYRKFAEDLAVKAGKLVLAGQKKLQIVKYKDLQDVTTSVDLKSEKLIIDAISKKYPSHSINSEEGGGTDNKSDFRWTVDPIDGTKTYVRNIPLYNVSICLEFKGEPVAGAIYLPASHQLYSASKSDGAFCGGAKIKISGQKSLKASYVGFYFPTKNRKYVNYEKGWKVMKKVSESCYRIHSQGSSNIALCWFAQGGLEAYINLTNPPHHHDLVTGLFIAKEAGGMVKEFKNGTFIVANNKYIY